MLRSIKQYFFQCYNNGVTTLQNMEIYSINNTLQSENNEITTFYRNSPNRIGWSGWSDRLVGLVGSVGRVGRIDQLSRKVPEVDQVPQVGIKCYKTYVA